MANINDALSTFHISDLESHRKWQPGKGNFFELTVLDIDSLLRPGIEEENAGEGDYITNGAEVLKLTVKSFKIPTFEVDDLKITKGNSTVHYAGTPTFQSGSITIDDMVGPESKAVLEAWHNLCYNVLTDKGGRAINYKKDCVVTEYTSDHVKVRAWKLIGTFPTTIDEDDYDKESGDIRHITATLIYDRAVPTLYSQDEFK